MRKYYFIITSLILICLNLTGCRSSSDTSDTQSPSPDSIASDQIETETSYLPDDWQIMPELYAFDQLVISREETVVWIALNYNQLTEFKEKLSQNPNEIVTLYLNNNPYELTVGSFRFDLNLEIINQILESFDGDQYLCARIGRNLPINTLNDEFDVTDGSTYVLSFLEPNKVKVYSDMLNQTGSTSLSVQNLQLCPIGNHGMDTIHTADIKISKSSLDDHTPGKICVIVSHLSLSQDQIL